MHACIHTHTLHIHIHYRSYVKLQKDLGSKETDGFESSSPLKQFQKVSKENDKLRKDLKKVLLCIMYIFKLHCIISKEVDNSESLQLKITRLQVENNKLQDEMQKMVIAARAPCVDNNCDRAWENRAYVHKIYPFIF